MNIQPAQNMNPFVGPRVQQIPHQIRLYISLMIGMFLLSYTITRHDKSFGASKQQENKQPPRQPPICPPRFMDTVPQDLSKSGGVTAISQFGSCNGHASHGKDGTICATLKHYFNAPEGMKIQSPFTGVIFQVRPDGFRDWQIFLRPSNCDSAWVRVFHVHPSTGILEHFKHTPDQPYPIKTGDIVGHHSTHRTFSDLEIWVQDRAVPLDSVLTDAALKSLKENFPGTFSVPDKDRNYACKGETYTQESCPKHGSDQWVKRVLRSSTTT